MTLGVVKVCSMVLLGLAGCAPASPRTDPVPQAITDDDTRYFSEHPLMVPVAGVSPDRVRNSFNDARGGSRTHRAIDIPAPRETPVVAAISGEVISLKQNAAGGITAYLADDERRYVYYYAHLEYYSAAITEGLKVHQGFVIGFVGTSGNAPPDTPHLHFQVMRLAPGQRDWWNGSPVDARVFMTKTGAVRE